MLTKCTRTLFTTRRQNGHLYQRPALIPRFSPRILDRQVGESVVLAAEPKQHQSLLVIFQETYKRTTHRKDKVFARPCTQVHTSDFSDDEYRSTHFSNLRNIKQLRGRFASHCIHANHILSRSALYVFWGHASKLMLSSKGKPHQLHHYTIASHIYMSHYAGTCPICTVLGIPAG